MNNPEGEICDEELRECALTRLIGMVKAVRFVFLKKKKKGSCRTIDRLTRAFFISERLHIAVPLFCEGAALPPLPVG